MRRACRRVHEDAAYSVPAALPDLSPRVSFAHDCPHAPAVTHTWLGPALKPVELPTEAVLTCIDLMWQAHSSAAVVNFSENCDQELLPPYLDTLITKLMTLLQNGQRMVQVRAWSAWLQAFSCMGVEHVDALVRLRRLFQIPAVTWLMGRSDWCWCAPLWAASQARALGNPAGGRTHGAGQRGRLRQGSLRAVLRLRHAAAAHRAHQQGRGQAAGQRHAVFGPATAAACSHSSCWVYIRSLPAYSRPI